MSLTTRHQLFAAYRRQLFSLPDSMIYYIAKNPSSPEVYQKLIQSCKCFRHKNPILVLHCLLIDDDGWRTCSSESECKSGDLTKKININIEGLSGCKLWVRSLQILSTNPRCASDLIPFMYQCDAKALIMINQNLSLQQFLFLARDVKCIVLQRAVINSDAGAEVPLEEIVVNCPKLEGVVFECAPESKNVTSSTVKNLLQIPHFKNMKLFGLANISEEFDIDSFFNYYKNMDIKLAIGFKYDGNVLSEEYAAKIEEFTTYVLGFPDVPATISYPGQDESTARTLWESWQKFLSV